MSEENLIKRIEELEKQLQEVMIILELKDSFGNLISGSKIRGGMKQSRISYVNFSEIELVDSYHQSPQLLSCIAITVSLTAESYQGQGNKGIYFQKSTNGNYWVIATQPDTYWLVPKEDIQINSQSMRTVEKIFECQAYESHINKHFSLIKPAKVSLTFDTEEWKLEERGKLDFSNSSHYSSGSLSNSEIKEFEQKLNSLKLQLGELIQSYQKKIQSFEKNLSLLQEQANLISQLYQKRCAILEKEQENARKEREHLQSQILQIMNQINHNSSHEIPSKSVEINQSSPVLSPEDHPSSGEKSSYFQLEYNLTKHTDTVYCLAISPWKDTKNHQLLASGGFDNTINLWNLDRGEHILSLPQSSRVNDLCFSPTVNAPILISGMDNHTVRLYRLFTSDVQLISLEGHLDRVSSIAISPDGKKLISGGSEGMLKVWDLDSSECCYTIDQKYKGVFDIVIDANSQSFIVFHGDCSLRKWDLNTGKLISILAKSNSLIWSIAISPDGQTLAYADGHNNLILIDLKTNSKQFIKNAYEKGIYALAFHPNSEILASGGLDKVIKLWDIKTQKLLTQSSLETGHKNNIHGLIFSPDGQRLVSCGKDKIIKIWKFSETPTQKLSFFDLVQ